MYRAIYVILMICLFPAILFAQEQVVTGIVTTIEDGSTMPGVNVVVPATSTGTITDMDGNFSIKVPEDADTLMFSFVGYAIRYVNIQGRQVVNVQMAPEATQLKDVVITALGIKRDKKSLGYSVQEVDGEELQTARDVSMINQLSGRVAGLTVTSTNGGIGSSSRIVLRGNKSLSGNNQALIVLDGVPILNETISNSENEWGGTDYGSAISDINPDDIESIFILKGASAAALYGSDAANGVILITTKKGKTKKGLGITVNSSFGVEQPYTLWKLQNKYGAGRNGKFEGPWKMVSDSISGDTLPRYDKSVIAAHGSWGPEMKGQTIIDWDGTSRQFIPQPDNYIDIFRYGKKFNNSFSLDGILNNFSFFFNVSDLKAEDIVENSWMKRNNVSLNTTYKLFEKLEFNVYASYVYQRFNNRLGLSDASTNISRGYVMMPRNIPLESLRDNMMNAVGNEQTWFMNWSWQRNPYYSYLRQRNWDQKDRFFGHASVKYNITDDLSVQLRTASDHYTFYRVSEIPKGTIGTGSGHYGRSTDVHYMYNNDFLIFYKRDLNKNFSLSANFGGNEKYIRWTDQYESTSGGLTEQDVYTLENSVSPAFIGNTNINEKAVQSLYGSAQLDYKHLLFLDLTDRNDWSSTLPKENFSFNYPSASLGFVFTDVMDLSYQMEKIFSYGKLRISCAGVGNGAEQLYLLSKTYFIETQNNAYDTVAYIKDLIPPVNLRPEHLYSYETGTDLRFFRNRVSLDFTWYMTNMTDQILSINVPASTGSNTAVVNSGNVQNTGVELQLNMKPFDNDVFKWNSTLLYTKNNSVIKELHPFLESQLIYEHWHLYVEGRPGRPYGEIYGYGIKRNEDGEKVVNCLGLYERTDSPVLLGNQTPDFMMSFNNKFSYKNITLSFLIDVKVGGDIYSGTNMYGSSYSGTFVETLEGREEWYASEDAREEAGLSTDEWLATGGKLAGGVFMNGVILLYNDVNPTTIDSFPDYYISNGLIYNNSGTAVGEDLGGQPNNLYVDPEEYWNTFTSYGTWLEDIQEPFVYDASYVKLREAVITYRFPAKWAEKVKMKDATISFYGRNLWLIFSNVPNIDPEAYYTNGNAQGLELYSWPNRRSWGINLKLKF